MTLIKTLATTVTVSNTTCMRPTEAFQSREVVDNDDDDDDVQEFINYDVRRPYVACVPFNVGVRVFLWVTGSAVVDTL